MAESSALRSALVQPAPIPADDDPAGFSALLAKVEGDRGFGCRSYKERCLRRRIAVRMRATGVHTFADYARVLDADPVEYDRLLDALTINVTKLFRNWEAWEALDARVLAPRIQRGERPVRAWSAGTASGEEAYSLAALLHARAVERGEDASAACEVLGTDVDPTSLRAAVAGAYAEPAFADAPGALRARYFTAGLPARVRPELRAIARFAQHDLLRDRPPAGPWDLIVCRNVLIYFDRGSQEALLGRFHDALAPGGTLFLGKVETLLGPVRRLFTPVDHRHRIFTRA